MNDDPTNAILRERDRIPPNPENPMFAVVVQRRFIQAGDDQQDDDLQLDDPHQTMEIESLDSGSGTFVRLSTARWCFETVEDIDSFAHELKRALAVDALPAWRKNRETAAAPQEDHRNQK